VEHFQVAHIKVQGVDLKILFVNAELGHWSPIEQQVVNALQACASAGCLPGNVVPVWCDSAGRRNFIAPPNQHAFFKSVTFEYLAANINKTL
jgi:hypothetical protein